MAKLPSSFRASNRTSRNIREQYAQLPEAVQKAVRDAARLFHDNPSHRSLRHHELEDNKKGKHHPRSFSVSPTMQYRALYVIQDGVNIRYWVGTHAEYKRYTGSPR